MKYPFRRGWLGIAALSLLGVGALAITCRFTPGCPLFPTSRSTLSPDTDQASFEREVLKSDVPVLVEFYADWCPACRAMAPTLERWAAETPDAKIVKVNVDDSPELAARYGIESIPSLLVFKDGQVVAEHVGPASTDQLRELISR
jgi:thioredoxin 1